MAAAAPLLTVFRSGGRVQGAALRAVLFKKDKTAGRGFSEKQIASFEAAAGIRFPAALREYYLVCGKASLNYGDDPMLIPAKDAKKGEDNVVFSYDYIKEELQWLKDHGETGYEDQEQLRVLPVEKWNEIVGNYLLICVVPSVRVCVSR